MNAEEILKAEIEHAIERRLLAAGQLDLRLYRLRNRRLRVHDRNSHSIGLDRAHHTGEGRGDSVRYCHGTYQFCGIGVGSIRWMAIRGRESILRARHGVQSCSRGERRRGRELLATSPFASSRRSSMVGLTTRVLNPLWLRSPIDKTRSPQWQSRTT